VWEHSSRGVARDAHCADAPVRHVAPLIDGFGRRHTYLRIAVTDRCNLRCRYCFPSGASDQASASRRDGERAAILSFEEIVRVARVCAGMGISKIRLTGGEPLMRKGLPILVGQIAKIPGIHTVGMTTNGVLLRNHVGALREAGLTHLNISLDSLRSDRFERIALRPGHADVMAGLEEAQAAGFPSLKLNVVVMDGVNDDELIDFVRLTRSSALEVRFIEYMPFADNQWSNAAFMSCGRMQAIIERTVSLEPVLGEGPSPVARRYRVPGWVGTVGFIASMSDHFCGSCNRIRLTADGSLKSCLFHPAEIGLRASLRDGSSDRELEEMIRAAVASKPAHHPPAEELLRMDNRTMIDIGG
jgi:molybdenum cofactor biosynthesis protein A